MLGFILIASIYLTTLVLVSILRPRPERRVALVIGNSFYKHWEKLENPQKDAKEIGDRLNNLGFDVEYGFNLDKLAMERKLKVFREKTRGAGWALVYYAGHGVELNGENWLIPSDAEKARAVLPDQAIRAEHVLDRLWGASRLRIMILDACRDCRLPADTKVLNTRGLAPMKPTHGEIVFFAARHRTEASDGKKGENSPFAKALLNHMVEEGLEIGRFFRKVTSSVLKDTEDEQEPFVYGRIPDQEFYFKPRR